MTRPVIDISNISAISPGLPPETSAVLKIFGRSTLWIWLDRGLLPVGTAVMGLFLVRSLGPGDFGSYSLAISSGTLVATILDFGLTRYAARTIAADAAKAPIVFYISVLLTAVLLVIELAMLVLALSWQHEYIATLGVGLIFGNFERLNDLTASFLRAELRARAMFLSSIFGRFGKMAMIGVAVLLRLSVLQLLIGMIAATLPVTIIRFGMLRSHWPGHWRRDLRGTMQVMREAWPFCTYSITEIGYQRISLVCFSLVAPRDQVGWFAAAIVIASVLPQWTQTAGDALLPVMTKLHEARRTEDLLEMRQRLMDLLILLTVPAALGLAFLAPQVCTLLGGSFFSSTTSLRILAIGSLMLIIEGILGGAFLTATNLVYGRRNAMVSALVILAALTLVFGHFWGPSGAAIASVIASVVILVGYLQVCTENGFTLRIGRTVFSSAIGGLVMVSVYLILSLKLGWELGTALAVAAYFGVLFLLSRSGLIGAGRTLRACVGI